MKTKKELQREFKEQRKRAGVFRIVNTATGKTFLGSTSNLHGPLNKHRFMLSLGGHPNKALQADWNALGESCFRFEIVEAFEHKDEDPAFNLEDELSLLEEIWIEQVKPFSDSGYNRGTRIRE